jgi:hypothetical protein
VSFEGNFKGNFRGNFTAAFWLKGCGALWGRAQVYASTPQSVLVAFLFLVNRYACIYVHKIKSMLIANSLPQWCAEGHHPGKGSRAGLLL